MSTNRQYRLEDAVNSVESLLQDVHRSLTRTAIKGAVSAETRRHMVAKLKDAAKYVEKLPLFEEDE